MIHEDDSPDAAPRARAPDGLAEALDARGYTTRQDGFSLQISRVDDPRFWVRLVLPVDRMAVFSDCVLSGAPAGDIARILASVLASAPDGVPEAIVFRDVFAGDPADGEARRDMVHRHDALVLALAEQLGRIVGVGRVSTTGGRTALAYDLTA